MTGLESVELKQHLMCEKRDGLKEPVPFFYFFFSVFK